MTSNGELLNSAEVCAQLGIDRSTLTRRVAAGRVPYAGKAPGVRGAYLFHRADIERLAAERTPASVAS